MDDADRRYFDATPCYLTVQDRDFHIIRANERFRQDFGDIEGRCCYQVYKRQSEKCEVCPVELAFRDGRSHRVEEWVTSREGKEIAVVVETMPVRDDDGEITSVVKMLTDVTHIRRLEEQLRQSQQRYRLLFEEIPCYVSIQDVDGRIIEMNRAVREDFGATPGCKCYEVYKHRTEPCFPCPVGDTFEDGQRHTREEILTSLRGEQIDVLVTTAPIRNAKGEIIGVMEMSANITEVRALESRLTSLGLLIGSISHALKGLLNGLAGGMYLVDTGFQKEKPDRVQQGWEIIQRNVGRIKATVSDILYYAKDREPIWETISAAELANEVCNATQTRAAEHQIRLTCDVAPTAGDFEADSQAVRSLLVNLLENSLDACRLDNKKSLHEVTLQLRGFPDYVQFGVMDNGIGMDQETREKAFSLFFSSKGMEGTGLGLFIANRIAQAHGGSIALDSQVGAGTQFLVKLPRKRPLGQKQADSHPCE